jgi:hypothetical protein
LRRQLVKANDDLRQDLKENVARVVIFYDELKETIITQDIKVQLSDLVSNVGGLLGLFLGN